MKYKFKSQTGILVAGLLAASYANACFYQQTASLCFASGATVDTIYWAGDNAHGTSDVKASSDWWMLANGSTGYLTYSAPGTGPGHSAQTTDNGSKPLCHGPASFKDYTLDTISVTDWVPNSANLSADNAGLSNYATYSTYTSLTSGTATGSTCTQ